MNALDVSRLNYSYADGTEALKGLSFSVAEGEHIGLIGPNGAGKSTLLLHLNGLLPGSRIKEPKIHVFGMPVIEKNLSSIRASVGLLFQDPDDQLFCSTVGEDVAFGPQQLGLTGSELEQRVAASLKKVNMEALAQKNPNALSRGEKRRACLAGLLACNCHILVLDEPTTDLDPRGRRELKQLLRDLTLTQIIATHDLELVVEHCSRVLVLDQGRIVAEGNPSLILADEPLMLKHGLECPHILRHRHPH